MNGACDGRPAWKIRFPPLVVLIVFLLPWSSVAQVPSIVESSTLQASAHSWKRVLRNQSPSSLVAYMADCNPKLDLTTIQDALLNGGPYIGTGQTTEASVGNPSICETGIRAAIFSDGHAEGDREFVAELFAERRGAYQALGDTIKLLASVYTQHVPAAEITDKLEAERKANLRKGTHESGGYNFVLIDISNFLKDPGVVWRFPPEYQGQRQQLPSIEDVMNTNGLSHDEARVFLLNKRLEAWKSLLQNNLQPRQ
jgi:hypothetical protein